MKVKQFWDPFTTLVMKQQTRNWCLHFVHHRDTGRPTSLVEWLSHWMMSSHSCIVFILCNITSNFVYIVTNVNIQTFSWY